MTVVCNKPDCHADACQLRQTKARIRALEAALRESGEQLRRGAYHVGELGMAWTATIVTPECQKIQRTLKAAYQASLTVLETKPELPTEAEQRVVPPLL